MLEITNENPTGRGSKTSKEIESSKNSIGHNRAHNLLDINLI